MSAILGHHEELRKPAYWMRLDKPQLTNASSALLGLYTARCRGGNGLGLERILPLDRTRFYGYGRQALAEAFRRAGVSAGDEVLLPGFLCGEVLASLALVGAMPKFYQVNKVFHADVSSWDALSSKKLRAVVAVNYFGFPQPLDRLREWCRVHGTMLIEDNAHGFLSEDGETPLGRRGDLGIFSLRKTLALPNGAALVDNRQGKMEDEGLSFRGSCRGAEWRYRVKVSLKKVIESTGLTGARLVLSTIKMVRLTTTVARFPSQRCDRETIVPQEAISPLTRRLLRRCHLPSERQRRREAYQLCRELFDGFPNVSPLFDTLPDGVVPQGFPFLYTGKAPHTFIQLWGRHGVPILPWPDRLPAAIKSHAPDYYGRVMLVPFLW